MRITPSLNIVVALNCEAKPLVDYYRLTKGQALGFSYFKKNADELHAFDINLLVSGIGSRNMAAACGWLSVKGKKNNCVWLNIGIAGHKDHSLGDIARVIKVSGVGSEKFHYPALVAKWSNINSPLISYPEPCKEYPENALVDMEGDTFFDVANKFSSSELVQSLKIVSDNSENGIETINAAGISELIEGKVDVINSFATKVINLLPAIRYMPKTLTETQHLHVTVSQLQQYKELVEKLLNLGVDIVELKTKLSAAKSMKGLLTDLSLIQQQTAPALNSISQPV